MTTQPNAQTTTLLFTDMVDSTELLQRAGDEDAQRIVKAHHKLLRDAVATNGGHEVKWLGDGLMVAFPAAADAVRCAIAMQQASRRAAGGGLAIRVGINAGDALRDESDYFGTPVVVAKRLCDRADGGQILCSSLVAGLLAGRQAFEFRDIGTLELKGIAAPVPASEVVYAGDEPGAFLAHTPFIGRGREVARLQERFADARAGRGGMVVLVGEPGIGKTRMAEEFAETARAGGGVVLWGRCYEGEWAPPYGAFAEAIGKYAASAEIDELRSDLGFGAAPIARLAPAVREVLPDVGEPPPLQPDEERFRLLDAVSQFLIRVSQRTPAVIVLDDLHWADRGTIAMLRHVARFAAKEHMLVLGMYRDVDLDRQHPLADALSAMRREVEYERIVLKGLDEGEVGALLSTIAEQEANPALVHAISEETDGNPFFIREVLAHLVEEGKLYREGGRWTGGAQAIADFGIPEGVRQVLTRRLSRLSDTANRFMAAASAFNGAFNFQTVSLVLGVDDDTALDAVDAALDHQLLRPTAQADHYEFTHALIRHTLFGEMNPSRQVRLHRQIAEAYEQRNTTPEAKARHAAEMAYQFHRSAAMPGAERGVEYALVAAEQAEAMAAWDEAVGFLRMALELLPREDGRRARITGRLAITLMWALQPEEGAALALEAGDLIAAAEGDSAAADYFRDAGRACGTAGATEAAWALAGRGMELIGNRRDATWAWLRNADLARREAADPLYLGIGVRTPEREEVWQVVERLPREERWALGIGAGGGAPTREDLLSSAEISFTDRDARRLQAAMLAFALGDGRRGGAAHRALATEAEQRGMIAMAAFHRAQAARCSIALGELAEAGAEIARGYALAARVGRRSGADAQLFGALFERAIATGEGWQELADRRGAAGRTPAPDRWLAAVTRAGSARGLAELGRGDEAVALLGRLLDPLNLAETSAGNYPVLACNAADLLWLLGRVDHLDVVERNLREKVIAPDQRYVNHDGRSSLARLCALTGRHDEASRWFAQARTVLEEDGARPLRAIVDYDEALMYARRGASGDAALARPLLDAAMSQFREIGMTGWLQRADQLLESF